MFFGEGVASFGHSALGAGNIYFREAEIENFCVSALSDENIGGLNVAVDDSLGMGGVESVGNFDRNLQNALQIHRPAVNDMFQGVAIEKFHGNKGAGIMLTNIVDGANVGMI